MLRQHFMVVFGGFQFHIQHYRFYQVFNVQCIKYVKLIKFGYEQNVYSQEFLLLKYVRTCIQILLCVQQIHYKYNKVVEYGFQSKVVMTIYIHIQHSILPAQLQTRFQKTFKYHNIIVCGQIPHSLKKIMYTLNLKIN